MRNNERLAKENRKFYDNEVLDADLRGVDWETEGTLPLLNSIRYEEVGWLRPDHIPETRLQALMEAAPFEEPKVSLEDTSSLKDVIADAIESLDEQERDVWECRYIFKMSYRKIGRELRIPHTTAKLRADRAQEAVQKKLLKNETIQKYLGVYDDNV